MAKVRKAVITAAGWGTRFLPATKAQPKEMLPLIDKPMIQYAIEDGRLSLTAWDKIRKESDKRQVEILEKATKASRSGRATTTAVRKARKEIAAEENGKPALGDKTVVERWNTVKDTIVTLLDVPTPAGDERRIAYVCNSIVEMLS